MKAGLYLRVSTSDQTTLNQELELRKYCELNEIEIYNIKLLEYNYPDLKIEVDCSTGTYIRTLANDIGAKLGTGAYCDELRRTKIGEYDVKDAKLPTQALPLSGGADTK